MEPKSNKNFKKYMFKSVRKKTSFKNILLDWLNALTKNTKKRKKEFKVGLKKIHKKLNFYKISEIIFAKI